MRLARRSPSCRTISISRGWWMLPTPMRRKAFRSTMFVSVPIAAFARTCPKPHADREQDEQRVARALERVSEAHRARDPGQRECQRQAVLDDDHDAGDDHRQDNDRID